MLFNQIMKKLKKITLWAIWESVAVASCEFQKSKLRKVAVCGGLLSCGVASMVSQNRSQVMLCPNTFKAIYELLRFCLKLTIW